MRTAVAPQTETETALRSANFRNSRHLCGVPRISRGRRGQRGRRGRRGGSIAGGKGGRQVEIHADMFDEKVKTGVG